MTTKNKEPKINLIEALKAVVDVKNIDDSIVEDSLKEALITAARKYLNIDKHFDVNIDKETGEISIALVVDISMTIRTTIRRSMPLPSRKWMSTTCSWNRRAT